MTLSLRSLTAGVMWLAGCVGFCAFPAHAQSRIDSRQFDPVWQSDTPCGADVFAPPRRLPSSQGPARKTRDGGWRYDLKSGGAIFYDRVSESRYAIRGQTYRRAARDMVRSRPVVRTEPDESAQTIVLARVHMWKWVQAVPKARFAAEPSERWRVDPKQLSLRLQPTVTLAEWVDKPSARDSDQRKWDRRFCESAHHEMGHILIALQQLEAVVPDLLALRAPSQEALQTQIDAVRERLADAIAERQRDYHDIVYGRPRGDSFARPYLDQDMPWLDGWPEPSSE